MCNCNKNIVLKHYIYLLFMLWCASPLHLSAQSQQQNRYYDMLEELSINAEETPDWEDILQELSERKNTPLNLNVATKEELEEFPFLTDNQIENILAYIYIKGEMQTVYELLLIEGMSKETIDLLAPFVVVEKSKRKSDALRLKNALKYGKNNLTTRFGIPLYNTKGYKKSYLGPAAYHALKYTYQYKDRLYFGVAAEKDKGEPFAALHNRKGYDWYSIYFLIKDLGIIKSLSAGNYKLNFGQGLVLGSDYLNGKTMQVTPSPFKKWGIYKHSSTDEFNYLRGAAITLRVYKRIDASVFYSNRKLDGKVKGDTLITIDKSGLHRTDNEVLKRDKATLQLFGGNIQYEGKKLHLGITGIYYCLDKHYLPTLSGYSKYNMTGMSFYNIGVNYAYRRAKWAFDGEIAKSSKGVAAINKLQYTPSSLYRLLLVHRYYEHHYWAFFANSFSEGSRIQNENGWYVAVDMNPIKRMRLFVAADFFSFPWLKYRISKSSQGFDLTTLIEYTSSATFDMRAYYRIKSKERDLTGQDVTRRNYHHKWHYRLNCKVGQYISLRSFIDYNRFCISQSTLSQGYQISQRISYNLKRPTIALTGQISYFHTDNYDSRVYIVEKGLINSFYVPAFSGHGIRGSAVMRYDFLVNFTLIAKSGTTIFLDRSQIGSGNDVIDSNRKTDIELQLRYKF